jgi:5-carboxymethyl-2-hydroxymuconate isomerase
MKNRIQSHFDEVQLIAKLADLKEDHYQTSLLLSAITELLIEKGILTADQIRSKADQLDHMYASSLAGATGFIPDPDRPNR